MKTKSLLLVFLALAMLVFPACADESEAVLSSHELVTLYVDTSRYAEEGYLDISLTNNSPDELTTTNDVFCMLYHLEDGEWVQYSNTENVNEHYRRTVIKPDQTLDYSYHITFWQENFDGEVDMPGGTYMIVFAFEGLDIGYTVAPDTDAPYLVTSVFELPARTVDPDGGVPQ